MKIISPGNIASHHALDAPLASFRSEPHVTVVALTPNPRKLKAASVRIAPAIANAPETSTGAIAFGITCLKIICFPEKPMEFAAVMYSMFLTFKTSPLMSFASPVHDVNPIAAIIYQMLEP